MTHPPSRLSMGIFSTLIILWLSGLDSLALAQASPDTHVGEVGRAAPKINAENIEAELRSLGLDEDDIEIKAIDFIISDIKTIKGILEYSLDTLQTEYETEKKGGAGTFREASQINLKNVLTILPIKESTMIIDQLLQNSRSKAGLKINDLYDMYWKFIQEGISLADEAIAAERAHLDLIQADIQATHLTILQLEALDQGLRKFKEAIGKWFWRDDPAAMAEFFASDAFKERIQKISENVGKIQAGLAKRKAKKNPPGGRGPGK